jgi:hypothetical protein
MIFPKKASPFARTYDLSLLPGGAETFLWRVRPDAGTDFLWLLTGTATRKVCWAGRVH